MTEPLVRVRALTKTYEPSPYWLRTLLRSSLKEPVVALDSVDLDVEVGRVCTVIGPNGAGKSTLFRVLTGLTTATSGSASVGPIDCATRSVSLRRAVGFMAADDRSLFMRHTCRENLRFHGRLHGFKKSKLEGLIQEALDRVGLAEAADRGCFALSAGMRARLQLARALLHRPQLLILDEPTGSVDPVGAQEFLRLIRGVAVEQETAILLSSHRLEEIEALGDNVVFLDAGRVVHAGPLDDLRRLLETPRVRVSFRSGEAAKAALRALASWGGEALQSGDCSIDLLTDQAPGEALLAMSGHLASVTDIERPRLSLSEAMVLAREQPTGGKPHADGQARVVEHA